MRKMPWPSLGMYVVGGPKRGGTAPGSAAISVGVVGVAECLPCEPVGEDREAREEAVARDGVVRRLQLEQERRPCRETDASDRGGARSSRHAVRGHARGARTNPDLSRR